MLLPLDDLLAVLHEFINPDVSRSGLDRCLRRHGVSDLKSLQPQIEGQAKPPKTFKDYEPGFLHIDIKYLPQMRDETHRRYRCEASIGCIRCSSGLGLGDWKSPNTQTFRGSAE